jgi:hypothetical protein
MKVQYGHVAMLGMPASTSDHEVFISQATIKQVYLWWPRRCDITGKRLWLTCAYRGIIIWTGPGNPIDIEEVRYYDTAEYLMQQLKQ